MNCTSRYCQYNMPGQRFPPNRQKSICSYCRVSAYCSDKCRQFDWNNHKLTCLGTQKQILHSLPFEQLDETQGTLKEMKKRPEDFEIINSSSNLGQGSFGAVKLAKEKSTGKLYAMKIMNKKEIFEHCSLDNLKREIKIQRKLTHPNVTQLYHYFEDRDRVYLILEYAKNGCLFNYLRKKSQFPESEAFVYFFQTALGLEYLHKNNIIHRDLKPENLLLDEQGNIKICDFGFSAEVFPNKTRTTFCGTIEYMAPEMIMNKPHDYTLDLWSLGVLLFELLQGRPPFVGKSEMEKCSQIISGKSLDYTINISSSAKNLIESLVKLNPFDRLNFQKIYNHPWMIEMASYHGINIKDYIFDNNLLSKNAQKQQQPSSQTTTGTNNSFEYNQKNVRYSQQDQKTSHDQPRVSRYSQRNKLQHSSPKRQETGFFKSILIALGCMNRPRDQKNTF